MIPNCPKHGTPMVPSKFGGFYCQRKDGAEFCKQKVAAAPSVDELMKGSVPMSSTSSGSDDRIAAASLIFAATLMRGAGPEMADEAIALAIRACSAMKATR